MDSYLDSSRQGSVPPTVPSRVAGGLTQSSASSGIFFQGDDQSQNMINSHLSKSFGSSANSIPGAGRSNLGPVSGDVNQTLLNGVANSGPSVGASSLVTDANSVFSGGQMQRSASVNTESYMRLPASPMSFNSNSISVSGSSAIDGPSTMQQGPHPDPSLQQASHNQHQQPLQHGGSNAISLSSAQMGQILPQIGSSTPTSFMQDPSIFSQFQKKTRLEIKQEDILQQQIIQQLLQRQDPTQFPNNNPQLQAFIQQQQQRLRQQQLLQAMPQMQRSQLLQQQQQQQQQLQQQQQQIHLQHQSMQPGAALKSPYETGGVCARRLMQYLYHQRQRPAENSIVYWRKFVAEYYAPRAKKRWCLSLYDNVGQHALGVFPQAAMEAWHCDICEAKSGRGFEATCEVLARLYKIKFDSGIIDELLFVDLPRERRFVSGILMLEYGKAVQESVYEQLRVVREGQLRIIFSQDLKILSWEFCARRHEELLPRKLVAPQVNQLLQVAQKCQSTIAESGSNGVSSQDLQTNSNMVVMAGRQLAKSLDMHSVNDLGFSKRYVRCLQIAEVVNSMKDLIDVCRDNKAGPIESLKNFPRHASTPKLHMQKVQETEQLANMQGAPTDRNSINKLMSMHPGMNNPVGNNQSMGARGSYSGSAAAALANMQGVPTDGSSTNKLISVHPGMNNQMSNNQNMGARAAFSGSAASALALSNYQHMLMRNSMNPNQNSLQQEASSSISNSNQSPSSSFQGGAGATFPGPMQNRAVSGFSTPHLASQQQQQQYQQHNRYNGLLQQHQQPPQPHQNNQGLQQHMMQQLLQDMSSSSRPTAQQRSLAGEDVSGNATPNSLSYGNSSTLTQSSVANNTSMHGSYAALSKSGSFKTTSNSDSSAAAGGGNSGFDQKDADLGQPQGLLEDEMVGDISHDFTENGFFNNSDFDETMGYSWKA